MGGTSFGGYTTNGHIVSLCDQIKTHSSTGGQYGQDRVGGERRKLSSLTFQWQSHFKSWINNDFWWYRPTVISYSTPWGWTGGTSWTQSRNYGPVDSRPGAYASFSISSARERPNKCQMAKEDILPSPLFPKLPHEEKRSMMVSSYWPQSEMLFFVTCSQSPPEWDQIKN